MNDLLKMLSALTKKQQITAAAATVGMFVAILTLAVFANQTKYTLLFGGLDPTAAGEVIAALEARNTPHKVEGGNIFVDTESRDALRMQLAYEGMPASGTAGYELLDGLSGFGTTTQMFNATYLRAQEGELARTIQTNSSIRHARVHIAADQSGPFGRREDMSASVTLSLAGPGTLSQSQTKALQFMVSSAVSGLVPEKVTIVDDSGRLLSGERDEAADFTDQAQSEVLSQKVERLLEARVGPGNAMVEISIDRINERESIVERVIDPDSRVAISAETQENVASTNSSPSGMTVASDLPEKSESRAGDRAETSNETLERINYEISETRREVLRTPGGIRRQTIAVLVNGVADENGNMVPREAAEIAALQALVEDTVGFDAERGDEITVQSMVFQTAQSMAEVSPPSPYDFTIPSSESLLKYGATAAVALILGLFVVRPLLLRPTQSALPAPERSAEDASELTPLDGEIDMGEPILPDSFPAIAFDTAAEAQDPISRMRQAIEDKRDETMIILRNWLEDEREQQT
ncbi:flagellar basal-body MS-ring/collar protein FliF [Donghicola tyrosinivorans]|uniref:Flagellar M-ring protein n=1 Tax=Donghicola tyrosinivorans TaxID=1652492 RepID=A0A2T0WY06_9RHOB|nr:flagellar basal-body MS-ring/collar protein FliF [Donghicola tyrosinivorans]PRY91561.1 flagellar M-ring protein FliF [Donghicola tyrosinivorans]